MVLIRITLPGLSLPWVNLIIYKDDLRLIGYSIDGVNDSNIGDRKVYLGVFPFVSVLAGCFWI